MKRAYHDILFPDGTQMEGPIVVETDREGRCLRWYPLGERQLPTSPGPYTKWSTSSEEPSTEWVGGTYTLRTQRTNDNLPES